MKQGVAKCIPPLLVEEIKKFDGIVWSEIA